MKKYHYTYLIYCTEPKSSMFGCIYYGKHSTNNLLDGYIASGKKITRYINKYPNGYYRKILNLYNCEEDANKAEYNLIHQHLNKSYCLNMMEGGHGGAQGYESCLKISKNTKGKNKGNIPWNKGTKGLQKSWNKGKTGIYSDETLNKIRNSRLGSKNTKLSEYNKIHNKEKNKKNKTGTKIMNDGKINKSVHPNEFNLFLSKGFVFGMIKKKDADKL